MTYNRILLLSLIAMGGLIVILGVWVVMDSRGPVKETWATVISSRYV